MWQSKLKCFYWTSMAIKYPPRNNFLKIGQGYGETWQTTIFETWGEGLLTHLSTNQEVSWVSLECSNSQCSPWHKTSQLGQNKTNLGLCGQSIQSHSSPLITKVKHCLWKLSKQTSKTNFYTGNHLYTLCTYLLIWMKIQFIRKIPLLIQVVFERISNKSPMAFCK